MDKSTHEEYLSQPLQTYSRQFKIAVTFLSAYNGLFKVTNKYNKFYFTRSINDGDFSELSLLAGAYEIEKSNNECKLNIIEEGHFQETKYPFEMKPKKSTLGSVFEISSKITGS